MSSVPLDYRRVAPLPPISPVHDRLGHLDFLRGIALLLILVMNIQSFAMPLAASTNPWAFCMNNTADRVVWQVGHVLVYTKAMAMFTILFGVGILLLSERASTVGRSAVPLFYRRVGVLAAIGLVHGLFLWYGDILFMYAVVGSIVFLLRKLPAKWLLLIGATAPFIFIAFMLLVGAAAFGVPSVKEELVAEFGQTPTTAKPEIDAYRASTYAEQFGIRASHFAYMQAMIPLFGIPVNGGLMLIGMGLWKLRFFSADLPAVRLVVVAASTLLVGAVAMTIDQYAHHIANRSHRILYLSTWGMAAVTFASPFLAIGYLSLGMLVYRGLPAALSMPFRSAGQMALSGYLLTTIICTTIYYGYGFGQFMHHGRAQQLGVVLGVWAFLLIFSTLWLRAFRFGPFEWLWRSATYGTWQPLRRRSVSA